jgi:ribosomal protein L37AE/L43A
MATVTYFYEACPICGRPLRVDVRYLGRWVLCSHCKGEFIAGQQQFPRTWAIAPAEGVMAPAPAAEGGDRSATPT